MIDQVSLFGQAGQVLKAHAFRKRGVTWYRKVDDRMIWVINFQKGKSATKEQFDITINVGVYIKGIVGLVFGKEPEFVSEPFCFFRQRPRFFGQKKDWWDFDESTDVSAATAEISEFLRERAIPFLENNKEIDQLVSYMPMEKMRRLVAFHGELLRVAAAYLLMGRKDDAADLLKTISAEKNGWSEKSDRILNEMDQ